MPVLLAWFLYTNLVGALCAGVAWLAERVLVRFDRPLRWAWLGGIVLTGVVPAVQLGRTRPWLQVPLLSELDRHVNSALLGLARPEIVAVPEGGVTLATDPTLTLLVGWMVATGVAMLWLIGSAVRLRRSRRTWIHYARDTADFYLTPRLGPGVVGVFRQRVLLPQWFLGLEEDEREMLWTHECEHVSAGDNRLLAVGLLPLLLLPWIVALWWQYRRLRIAVEIDCDRRVLGRIGERRRYGELLLDVASGSVLLPVAPFSRRSSALSRRVEQIARRRATGRPGAALAAVAAAACLTIALTVPAPGAGASGQYLPVSLSTFRSTLHPAPAPVDRRAVLLNGPVVDAALSRAYPARLRQRRIEGRVGLLLHVTKAGRVDQVRVADPSEYPAFNAAARRIARMRRYRPAYDDGEPTDTWVYWPAVLRLADGKGATAG